MKILVLIKEVINLTSVDPEEDEWLPGEMDSDDIMMNPNDKHAVEAALQLKEKNEGSSVHAMCLGSENALGVLREAVAMGCDSASRVDFEGFLPSEGRSEVLTKAINQMDAFDLIFTGMAGDFGNSQIPVILAYKLNLPHLTYANTLETDGKSFVSERYIEGGSIKIKVPIPCIVSVASTANEPRYTSVKRILVAKRTQILVTSFDDLEIDEDSLKSMGGLEMVSIEVPDVEEKEVVKIESDDLEGGVGELIAKLKEAGVDLGGYK
ncbi:MAG: electron transfer flavoprotein subunit beta/FixA family protein [Candidatus Hodarchaeales archaeon]|jgi:electron transfer flavoprotein beta subunit